MSRYVQAVDELMESGRFDIRREAGEHVAAKHPDWYQEFLDSLKPENRAKRAPPTEKVPAQPAPPKLSAALLRSLTTNAQQPITETQPMTAQSEVLELQCSRGQLDAHEIEQRVRTLWNADPELRAEFRSAETAIHYFQAVGRGRVKTLKDQPGLKTREVA